ncbi:plasmid segregation protein ParM [Hafnia sp.]|uniref:plasmid segregation protein ParM n=1 Tax=Hafnia sp. TaxID=1873498 RepID=UPI002FC643EA
MKLYIDDGSTNIKLAWNDNGQRRNLLSPNSFKAEWSAPFGQNRPSNYTLDGVHYSFDPISASTIRTTHTQYQYSDTNVIGIHHALLQTGLSPQPVNIEVTLPLSEYFDGNNQPNMDNINRKKRNVMRAVQLNGGDTFAIKSVRVMPESIPAGFERLSQMNEMQSLLIVDLGGTTLDIALVRGQMSGITKVYCDPFIGVSIMTDAISAVLAANNMRTSSLVANDIILHRNDDNWLRSRLQNTAHYMQVVGTLEEKEETLKQRVKNALSEFTDFTDVLIVGGGAEIVAPAVQEVCGGHAHVSKSEAPQFALVNGLYILGE